MAPMMVPPCSLGPAPGAQPASTSADRATAAIFFFMTNLGSILSVSTGLRSLALDPGYNNTNMAIKWHPLPIRTRRTDDRHGRDRSVPALPALARRGQGERAERPQRHVPGDRRRRRPPL